MSVATFDLMHSRLAAIDLQGYLHRFATLTNNDELTVPAAGAVVIGTFFEVGPAGSQVTAAIHGVTKVELGAPLGVTAEVQTDGDGKAVALSSGYFAGILLHGGDTGDIVPIKLS